VPELPEVETYRTALEPRVVGRTFRRVEILDDRLTRPHDRIEVAAELEGERVSSVERRGKYLVVRFESGLALVIHLRMTGGFPGEATTHERAVVELSDGGRLAYRDVRRFGTWLVLGPAELEAYFEERLGPEPLARAFDWRYLVGRLARRRAAVKACLLDQRVVAGLGNIYVDEALWWARLAPLRTADSVTDEEARALVRGVRKAIRRGIERQGADLGDGAYTVGSMQDVFRVYGRTGEPCPRCRTPIEKVRVAGRGTHFCPACQR
jgi:formamidopyrimidine-DNA glycosylase